MSEPLSYFRQLELGPMQNFIYLVGDPKTREAVVVDPGWEVPRILEAAASDDYRITHVIVTHHHFDHVGGVEELLKTADLPVYAHRDEIPLLDLEPRSLKATVDGDIIRIGGVEITVIHTPGHTPGSQCLLVEQRLLSGDTLFIKAVGRWDLPGGDAATLYESLTTKLRPLDDAIVLYPGHNYAEVPFIQLGEEKRANPFLASPSREHFLRMAGVSSG